MSTFYVVGTFLNADNSPAIGTTLTFTAKNAWELSDGIVNVDDALEVTVNELGAIPPGQLLAINAGGYHVEVRVGGFAGHLIEFDLASPANDGDTVDLGTVDAQTQHFTSEDIGAAAVKKGGTANQVLGKLSDVDYDFDWIDVSGAGGDVISVAGRTGAVVLTSTDVGLALVDNTADASKPISAAQQAALDAKAPIASPTFTGTVTIPTGASITAPSGLVKGDVGLGNVDNTSDATKNAAAVTLTNKTLTAPVLNSPTGLVAADIPSLAESKITNLTTDLAAKAPLASPTFTGTVVVPAGTITLAQQVNAAANSFRGNNTGSAAAPLDMTVAQAKTLLALAKADVGLGSVDNTADTAKTIAGDITGTLSASVLSGSSNVESIIRANSLDQLTPPAANLSMNSKRVTSVADATAATDALNRQFGDGRYLQLASNLSDLNSAKTARSSTGLNVEGMTAVADANKTAAATDRVIGYSSISATRTVTLPAASAVNGGAPLIICDLSGSCGSGTNIINIAPAGADTIDGLAALALYSAYASVTLVSDGTSKWVYSSIVTIPWTVGQGGTGAATASAGFRNVFAFARHAVADANYTAVLTADTVIAYTSISAARTVTLPTAVGNSWALIIKDESGSASGTNIIKLATTSSQTVDGNASPFSAITTARGAYRIYSNGANWFSW